ncbi:hypothetical protein IscW_ISCW005193 [Ixodes scapularis]|uniref:Uncharacterized protein n=1 Tax=Ixodes scapularis TaxID=6945 RepID=B7PFG3_IXOSC|nr:hypothetical protein IscW_ISCW005193 [Ixodes scapularis]|eukprot:XP_002433935.1 hypothetical protein IscW_ISCW005193 [Ixodes scapularis]
MAQVAALLVLLLLWVAWTHAAPPPAPASTRPRRGALEELRSSIRWEYGGWRPIMPGSPFFFVKTSRAVPLDSIASASALTPVRLPAKEGTSEDSKEDLKAEASSASERVASESVSLARHVPVGLPPVGGIPGCCDFQPVLYVKSQPGPVVLGQSSNAAAYLARPESNMADDDSSYQKDDEKAGFQEDLKPSSSQIVHGSPIGDERPQLPHQLLQDIPDGAAHGLAQMGPLVHSGTALENVLSKLPESIHPVLQGQGEHIMSALSGLDGSLQPSNMEQLLQHVHASGGVVPDVERLIASVMSAHHGGKHGGQGGHQGYGGFDGQEQQGPHDNHPTAPPFHPRPDKNIFRWYPKPRAKSQPTSKPPTYKETPKRPSLHQQHLEEQRQRHAHQQVMGASPLHMALVQGPLHSMMLHNHLQQLEAPPLAHHYGVLDEIVRGRPQEDYDPRQPPRIHVEDVPADVLATGIHPNGHPIRVDGINLNIIAPSHPDPAQSRFPSRRPEPPRPPPPPPQPFFTHFHRPEDVASAPFFQDQFQPQQHQPQPQQQPLQQQPQSQEHSQNRDTNLQNHQHGNGTDYTDHEDQFQDYGQSEYQDNQDSNQKNKQDQKERDPESQDSKKHFHGQLPDPQKLVQSKQEPNDREQASGSQHEDAEYEQEAEDSAETPAAQSAEGSQAESEEVQQERPKEKKGQRGAIHFHPIQTQKAQKEEEKAQLYHAYYAPAQHKPPPGYVRMTVDEFNKLFKDAEIQFIGSESDLNKKLAGKVPSTKLQLAQSDSKEDSTVKIETVGEDKKTSVRTSVSVSTSSSSSDGAHNFHSVIQPRENAARATGDGGEPIELTTHRSEKTSSNKPVSENRDGAKGAHNLFGARLKTPKSGLLKQAS